MSFDTIKDYELCALGRGDTGTTSAIAPQIQQDLIHRPATKAAQRFLKQCWTNHQWIACSCAENAFLAIRRTTNFYTLVRLTQRGDHTRDCLFSEDNMPIYKRKHAERIDNKALSFHRARALGHDKRQVKSPISINGLQAEASKLARFMFTLYEESGLNTVPLNGQAPELGSQYKAIRQTASKYYIAGQSGRDVIFTHPGEIEKAKATLVEKKWPSDAIPQVLLFFTIDQITGRDLLIKVGQKEFSLTVQSRIEYFWDNVAPPFNALATLALRPGSSHPEVLRCSVIPILAKNWLLPVKNDLARHFVKSMLAIAKDYVVGDSHIAIPFFPSTVLEFTVRPDFSVERNGRALMAFYFLSKTDESYLGRRGEIDYLRSTGLEVFVFDTDKIRENSKRDIWKAAKSFMHTNFKQSPVKADAPERISYSF